MSADPTRGAGEEGETNREVFSRLTFTVKGFPAALRWLPLLVFKCLSFYKIMMILDDGFFL